MTRILSRIASVAAVGCLFLAGCQKPVLDTRVSAASQEDLDRWLANEGARLTPGQQQELRNMEQELKVAIMTSGEATGSEAVNQRLLEKINGLTLREVLLRSHQAAADRLERERKLYQGTLDSQSSLRTRPGDTASADYVAATTGNTGETVDRLNDQIAKNNARIKELTAKP